MIQIPPTPSKQMHIHDDCSHLQSILKTPFAYICHTIYAFETSYKVFH